MSLVVVGSVAYDTVETSHGRVEDALGGSATFFSLTSALFVPTHLVAVVGDDFLASDVARLQRRGVDTAGLQRVAGRTFRWSGRYAPHFVSRTTLSTELNVFASFDPKLGAAASMADCVFLANIHPALQASVLDQCARPRFVGLDTMNYWIHGEREALARVLPRVDCLFVNDEEAYALAEVGSLSLAAARILQMGPKALVIKRGEHGAVLFHGGAAETMPALLLDGVVDPTGAGDTFAGGFMGYVASRPVADHATLQGAVVMGTLAASHAVQAFSVDGVERLTFADLASRHQQLVRGLLPAAVQWPAATAAVALA